MAISKRDRDRLGAGTPQGSRGAHFRPVGSADACGCAGEPTLGGAPVRRGGRRPLKRAVIVAVAVLAMCGAGGAMAWFGVQDNVLNTFTRGEIQPSIEETFDASSTVKENVFVKNEGTAPAYMRATVSIYWEDKNGNQLWDAPQEGQGYSITYLLPRDPAMVHARRVPGAWRASAAIAFWWSSTEMPPMPVLRCAWTSGGGRGCTAEGGSALH